MNTAPIKFIVSPELRYCLGCGQAFTPPLWERWNNKKKYCSKHCSNKVIWKRWISR